MSTSHGNRQKHESQNPLQRALIAHFYDQLADVVRRLGPADLLDVGCGEGYALAALRARGVSCPVSGIDLSASAIDEARLRVPDGNFEVADALDLAARGRTYDVVMMTEVLEHIPEPDRMLPVLERLSRRHVVLSVPWEPIFRGLNFLRGKHVAAWGNDPEHVNHWSRRGFTRFVGRRFEVQQAPWAFPWTLVSAKRR